ncbi:MAG: ribonuclease J [Candidatus Margulisiibacteriota bacterium]
MKNKAESAKTVPADSFQIIPLGGLDGIGKNMQVINYNGEMLIIDAGMMFPDETMLGIDKVIPDLTFIRENKDKILAIILTHGHEDHIGALPFLLDEIKVPIYATHLTMEFAENKLNSKHKKGLKKFIVKPKDKVKIGSLEVEFIQVNHSIPDGVGLAIRTPAGVIVHTGDFKIDNTPMDGKIIDLDRFAEIGKEGVLVMLSDSTNADEPGFNLSERVVGESFEKIFNQASGRVIIALFASNINRIQQAIDVSLKCRRKFIFLGKSIEDNTEIAKRLGYLKYLPQDRLTIEQMNTINPDQVTVITTGSQGEPMSGLTKMARNDFKYLKIEPNDTIIISATPIPGNEKAVARNIDKLMKLGANVIYETESDIHVSGHAKQEEQKILLNLVKPRYFLPVHGEFRHLKYHARTAESTGIPHDNIILAENGDIWQFSASSISLAGKTNGGGILVDGLGRGEHGSVVLQDRRILSREGIFSLTVILSLQKKKLVASPVIKSRGFIYLDESDELMINITKALAAKLQSMLQGSDANVKKIKNELKNYLRDYLYEQTHRRPMILVVVVNI